jgi:hypothetical protein
MLTVLLDRLCLLAHIPPLSLLAVLHKGRYEILESTSQVLRRGKAQSVPNPWWRRGGRSLF